MMYTHVCFSLLPPRLTASGERTHALPQAPECTDSTGLPKKAAGKAEQACFFFSFPSQSRHQITPVLLFISKYVTKMKKRVISLRCRWLFTIAWG